MEVSIPKGAIEANVLEVDFRGLTQFQYQKVRLKQG